MVDTSSHYASGLSERLVGRVLREALLQIHTLVFPVAQDQWFKESKHRFVAGCVGARSLA